MRAAIYARVSSDRQRERETIKSQLVELPKYAASQDWKITRVYKDDGKSGESIEGRPEFEALLQDASRRLFDVLLVIDLDRITRSRRDQEGAIIYDQFRANGIKIATPRGGLIDLENEDQDLQIGLLRAFAKFEKRKFLSRTKRGKLQAARDGKRFSSIDPYGYKWVPDPRLKAGGGYQVVDTEARVVRRIYDLALEGQGIAMIAWALNAEGLQTRPRKRPGREGKHPSAWAKSTVLKLLHSTTFVGRFRVYRNGGEPITIPMPAIVRQETWDRVQSEIAARDVESGRPPLREYLLRGHASCGVCGYAMWSVNPRPGNARYSYYRCSTTNGWRGLGLSGPCGNKHHRTLDVDNAVWWKLLELFRDPKLLTDACSVATKSKSDGVDWASQLRGLERELKTLEQAASDVLRRQRRGAITSPVADQELDAIAGERKLVDRNLKLAQRRQGRASSEAQLVATIEEQAAALSRGLDNAEFETRRKLVALLLPRQHGCGVVLHENGGIEIKGLLPMPGAEDGVELTVSTRVRRVV